MDCVKACLLIGESSKANLGGIPAECGGEASAEEGEDIKRNKGKKKMGAEEREEMGAIYLLSNLDSPSALAWALLRPFSPLLR